MACVAQGRKILDPVVSAFPPRNDVVRLLGGSTAPLGVWLPKDRGALALAFGPDQQSVFAVRPVRACQLLAAVAPDNRFRIGIASLDFKLPITAYL
jgi:hypothetical protein